MRGLGAVILLIGLAGFVLPIFGVQFRVVTAVAEPLGLPTPLAAGILVASGFAISVAAGVWEAVFSPESRIARLERGLSRVGPTVEEILEHKPDSLSDESVRRIHPFYPEMARRGLDERANDIYESVAPRAKVGVDDLALYYLAVFKALEARERPERDD